MAEQDVPCPGCGYNLRGVAQDTCPECGATLHLTVTAGKPQSYLLALRLIFLALIVWNGVGKLPGAMMELVRYWQISGSPRPGASNWFMLYIFSELGQAVIVLVLAIVGLRATWKAASAGLTRQCALIILIIHAVSVLFHLVLLIVF